MDRQKSYEYQNIWLIDLTRDISRHFRQTENHCYAMCIYSTPYLITGNETLASSSRHLMLRRMVPAKLWSNMQMVHVFYSNKTAINRQAKQLLLVWLHEWSVIGKNSYTDVQFDPGLVSTLVITSLCTCISFTVSPICVFMGLESTIPRLRHASYNILNWQYNIPTW